MTEKQTKTLYSIAALGLIVFLVGILWQMRIQDDARQLLVDSNKQLQEVKDRLAKTHKPTSIHQAAVTVNAQALREDPSLTLTFQIYIKDPYLGGPRLIDFYKDNYGINYFVDPYSNNIIEYVIPAVTTFPFSTSSISSSVALKAKAEIYLLKHISNFEEIEKTSIYSSASKPGDDYTMFQWEYSGQTLHDGTLPRVQIVMSKQGDIIHYLNTYQLKD